MSSDVILEARDLKKYFKGEGSVLDYVLRRRTSTINAVDGVSMVLPENYSIGIIGESGSGKSVLLRTLAGLHTPTSGEVRFEGRPVSEFDRTQRRQFRKNVQLVFQNPFESLDPKMTVKQTLYEPLKVHGLGDREERVHDVLEQVELAPVEKYLTRYPKHLSGGEKQRVSIARALVLEPSVLLADEPVSMLDVSTQVAILDLLADLSETLGLSMVYVSHDLSTVPYICDEINVMYSGRIVESAPTEVLLSDPKHPYSRALMDAVPIPDPHVDRARTKIGGAVQDPVDVGEGCRFRDRCPERMDICEVTPRSVDPTGDGSREVACHLHYDHDVAESAEVAGSAEVEAGDGS